METNSPNGGRQNEGATGRSAAHVQADDSGLPPPEGSPKSAPAQQSAGSQPAPTDMQRSGSDRDQQRGLGARRGTDVSRTGGFQPLDTMMRLSREMDQLMDSLFGTRFGFPRLSAGWPLERLTERSSGSDAMSSLWTPRVDVRQRGDTLVIHAELPGVSKDAVRIETSEDGIAISGERSDTREENRQSGGYQLTERTYGSFYRSIPLPEGAQPDQAKATMREGVLEISVPIQQNPARRQIQIEG
jgi:HSP20 family protein